MPVHDSPIKHQRQSKARRERNQAILSRLKTQIKKARAAFEAKDPDKIQQALAMAISTLDKAASKGVIHKNKASRTISRLSRKATSFSPQKGSRQEAGPAA
jgi:small subunit ribosomal protein S20